MSVQKVQKDEELEKLCAGFREEMRSRIDKWVNEKRFRMVDLSSALSISPQVASKITNPSSGRFLSLFEGLRLSVLMRTPLIKLVPPETYMLDSELANKTLLANLGLVAGRDSRAATLAPYLHKLSDEDFEAVARIVKSMADK